MAAYLIVLIEKVIDLKQYSEYIEKARKIVEKYDGQYLVKTNEIVTISGVWKPNKVVVIKFENMRKLQSCFGSTEYREVAPLRENSTISKAIAVEGIE